MRGFTLLELLISITMIGLIALIITGAFRLGSRTVDSGEKRIESLERLRNSITILESQLMSEIPLGFEEDGNRRYYFQGTKDSVQFSTTYSIWGNQNGYVLTSLMVGADSNGKMYLKVKESPLIGGIEAEAILFEGFDEIYFEYFYKDPTAEEGNWISEWTDYEHIPDKVRVGLIKEKKDFSMILPLPSRDQQLQTSGTTLNRRI